MSIPPRMPHFPWWTTAVAVRELYEGTYRNLEAEWLLRKTLPLERRNREVSLIGWEWRKGEGVGQAQSAGRLESGDLEQAAMVSEGVQSNSSRKAGDTVAARDSTCSRGGCNHCPDFHMDQFQDTLQRASCFLLEAMPQNQRLACDLRLCLGCPGGKGVSVGQTPAVLSCHR